MRLPDRPPLEFALESRAPDSAYHKLYCLLLTLRKEWAPGAQRRSDSVTMLATWIEYRDRRFLSDLIEDHRSEV